MPSQIWPIQEYLDSVTTCIELVKDPERYFKLLTCQSTQVRNIQFVNDECVEVYYRVIWLYQLS